MIEAMLAACAGGCQLFRLMPPNSAKVAAREQQKMVREDAASKGAITWERSEIKGPFPSLSSSVLSGLVAPLGLCEKKSQTGWPVKALQSTRRSTSASSSSSSSRRCDPR